MAGFAKLDPHLQALGAKVVAAGVDPLDKASEVAAGLPFPVAFVQPSEFMLDAGGKVLSSTYSSGPIGRVDAADVIRNIHFRERQAQGE